jgi:hypothetical protein
MEDRSSFTVVCFTAIAGAGKEFNVGAAVTPVSASDVILDGTLLLAMAAGIPRGTFGNWKG